jgi:hypothetical protein
MADSLFRSLDALTQCAKGRPQARFAALACTLVAAATSAARRFSSACASWSRLMVARCWPTPGAWTG